MSQSAYILPADYAAYNVPTSATLGQLGQATSMVDAYLRRPEGLLFVASANGQPCYMAGMSPELTLTAGAAFGPGNGIVVPVAGPLAALQVGDCVVLDQTNAALVEAVQVASIDVAHGTLTLGNMAANGGAGVALAHASGCTIETGLMLTESRNLPKGRSTVMLSSTPVARVVGGTGRYAYGRRGDAASYNMDQFSLLASLSSFGGPPAWELWPANAVAGIDARTGELWVPAGIMMAYYSEVKVRYVAGWAYANLPNVLRHATAMMANAIINSVGIGTNKKYQAGDTSVERFTESLLDQDMKVALAQYRARAWA